MLLFKSPLLHFAFFRKVNVYVFPPLVTLVDFAIPGVTFPFLPRRYNPSLVLFNALELTTSVDLEMSIVGNSADSVQLAVCLELEELLLEPQAAKNSTDAPATTVTFAAVLKFI